MKIKYSDKAREIFPERTELEFLDKLKDNDIDIHSLIIYKADEVVFESYYGFIDTLENPEIPNSEYALQRVYSVTKSFVSIAIGLLVEEGKVRLEDKIVDYYELLTGKKCGEFDNWMKNVSIENIMTMTGNHTKTTYKKDYSSNWVESFFNHPSDKEPGKSFNYESAGCHVLGALVEKLTGLSVMDYLRYRMPEIELSKEAYIMKDPFGVEICGSGLMCTARDMLRFAILIQKKGCIDGKQLINSEYIERACSKLVNTSDTARFPFESCGYGYFFWQHEHEGYMCYGMNGQFIYFLPKKKIIVITTADSSKTKEGTQIFLNIIDELTLRIG